MGKKADLTSGNILKTLTKLALPIMGTSFIQMAYNLTDMLWIGQTGSDAVAAIGTAGFFLWFAQSLIALCRIGAEVFVAQSIGEKDEESARKYAVNSVQLNIFHSVIYGIFLFVCRHQLIAFFKLGEEQVINMAVTYLSYTVIGIIPTFINPVFTGIFNGSGISKVPFMINAVGLVTNIILDPILIFGVGPFPKLGVVGAALATIFAQFLVTMLFLVVMKKHEEIYFRVNVFQKPNFQNIKAIIRLGFPVAIQSGIFSIIGMVLGRIIAAYGPAAIAVQKVGSQIESISWMTAGGFSTALSAFVGQNYGAQKYDRVIKGYKAGLLAVSIIGLFATILLVFFAEPIFSIFIPEKEAVDLGIVYLQILGLSQWFMTLEISTQGAFNGLGKTSIPSVVGIVFNALRIPAAYFLSTYTALKLNGIWWSISISSVFKGTVLVILFYHLVVRKYNKYRTL
ncbi:MAG TPA: MATE family efflux transporter [Clostridiales bacterium]|nr:MATE family efflux transporter [Clostridiales bacterium]